MDRLSRKTLTFLPLQREESRLIPESPRSHRRPECGRRDCVLVDTIAG